MRSANTTQGTRVSRRLPGRASVRWVLMLAAVGLGAAIAAACGSEDPPGGEPGGGGSAPTFATSDCGVCVNQACSAERAACEADPSCAAHLSCFDACPVAPSGNVDEGCAAGCPPVQGSTGQSALEAYETCRTAGPGAACAACGTEPPDGGADGGTCELPAIVDQDCPSSTLSDDCMRCQMEECCDSIDAIFNGGPATDLQECWLACPDADCELACWESHPDGVEEFAGYFACSTVNCEATQRCESSGPCGRCGAEQCSCEYANCFANTECPLIYACVNACADGDTACAEACIQAHPAGSADFDLFTVCVGQRCVEHCGGTPP